MNEDRQLKPNYNDPQNSKEYYGGMDTSSASVDTTDALGNTYFDERTGNPQGTYDMYSPNHYDYSYRNNYSDSFYNDRYRDQDESSGGFITGAIIGGLIGAAAALLLTPKTGKELRGDVTSQASNIKEKGIELSGVAKDKTSNLTKTAKEKTTDITKKVQGQTGKVVDKVKSMKGGQNAPMDDGTVSSEGEEPIELIDTVSEKVQNAIDSGQEQLNTSANALKDAVDKKSKQAKDAAKGSGSASGTSDSKGSNASELKDLKSGNTPYEYDNAENKGDDKVMGMNHVTKIENDKKNNKNT